MTINKALGEGINKTGDVFELHLIGDPYFGNVLPPRT